jgi:hypothetical protein
MTNESAQPEPTPEEYPMRPSPPAPDRKPKVIPATRLEDLLGQAQVPPQFSLGQAMLMMAASALFLGIMLRLIPNPAVFAGAMGALCIIALILRPLVRVHATLLGLAWWILLGIYLLACLRAFIEQRPPDV